MLIDFIIGFLLLNALPHFVLGVYKMRILSLFGFSSIANMAYGILCFCGSLGLYLYTYGFSSMMEDGFMLGGIFICCAYFMVAKILYHLWQVNHNK